MATADSPKSRLVQRLEAQRERHRQRGFVVRMLYTIVGFTVLIAGLLMLLLPGPAAVFIPLGLALLSLEFVWAENLLERALAYTENARRKVRATTPKQRIVTAIVCALVAAGIAVWGTLGDIPLLPF